MNFTEIRRRIRVNKLRAQRSDDTTAALTVIALVVYFTPLAIYLLIK